MLAWVMQKPTAQTDKSYFHPQTESRQQGHRLKETFDEIRADISGDKTKCALHSLAASYSAESVQGLFLLRTGGLMLTAYRMMSSFEGILQLKSPMQRTI